jgi:phosphoribosylaminoimidazolecarboxamide formyltransferase/IMP cyclohydrolase
MGTRKPTALLSAFNKAGLDKFAAGLLACGWDILASAGTAKFLGEKGLRVRSVSEIVGPPILGHRVVTLSRELHAALLAHDIPEDNAELERIGVPRIDLVYVDLYPLEEATNQPDATMESVLEMTDIGGPTILRAARKGGGRMVLCDPTQLEAALPVIISGGFPTPSRVNEENTKRWLERFATIAERRVADYCLAGFRFARQNLGLEVVLPDVV